MSVTVVEAWAATVTVASKVTVRVSPRARSKPGWERVRVPGSMTKPVRVLELVPLETVATTLAMSPYSAGRGRENAASKAPTWEPVAPGTCETTRRWLTASPASKTGSATTVPPASTMALSIWSCASRTVTASTRALATSSAGSPRSVSASSTLSRTKLATVSSAVPRSAAEVLLT